jgi:hypothetical protein
MYTWKVVTLRLSALVLALLFVATPVLAFVCQFDCDRLVAAPACHSSTATPEGPVARGTQHLCDHDQSTVSPTLLVSVSGRESVAALADFGMATVAYALTRHAGFAGAFVHGPPGWSGSRPSSLISLLRI